MEEIENTREILINFLEEVYDIDLPISNNSYIYEEFGIYSDDVDELLFFLVNRFSVDFDKYGENLLRYFSSEPTLIFPFEFLWRFFKYGHFRTKQVTVGHILRVIDRKEWFDPE